MKQKGFTLVEVIVVIAVIAIVLPAIYSIVFSVLKQQVLVYKLSEVKRQGDSSLSTIQNMMRPISGVYRDMVNEVCTSGNYPSSGYSDGRNIFPMIFKYKNDAFLQLYVENERLMLNNNGTIGPLTNEKVTVSSFQMSCKRRNSYSPSILEIIYQVKFKTNVEVESPGLFYRTRIVLRNN